MEDYFINSSIQKSVAAASKGTTDEVADELQEESGWTAYFEDFDDDDQQNSYSSSFSCSSSMISDAATTGAARKLSHNTNKTHPVFACSSTPKIPTELRFKKTRTREISEEADDSLEDTASSPVNSPKVSELMKLNDMNPRKLREDQIHSCLGIKETPSENYSEKQIEETRKLNFDDDQQHHHGRNDNVCTDLKKRGLCLVPFSMLVNYLG